MIVYWVVGWQTLHHDSVYVHYHDYGFWLFRAPARNGQSLIYII